MSVDQVTGPLTVGQLASRAGVRTDTIRYYERAGLRRSRSGPWVSIAGTGGLMWTGCYLSAVHSGWDCGWRRSVTCLPSATPATALLRLTSQISNASF